MSRVAYAQARQAFRAANTKLRWAKRAFAEYLASGTAANETRTSASQKTRYEYYTGEIIAAETALAEAVARLAVVVAEESEAEMAHLDPASWQRTGEQLMTLPVLDGDKPVYKRPGDESWHKTWLDVAALDTAEPERTVKSREEAGVEPPYKVSQGANTSISVPRSSYWTYKSKLEALREDSYWGREAEIALDALRKAYQRSAAMSDVVNFTAPTDTAIWSLIAIPGYANVEGGDTVS